MQPQTSTATGLLSTIISLASMLSVVPLAGGQTTPSTAPADPAPTTTPATAPAATRPIAPLPPGYDRMVVGNRVAYVLPADAAWVKAVLEKTPATTRPTTMPDDILARVRSGGPAVVKSLAEEVALPEAEVAKAFEDHLTKPLVEFSALPANIPLWVVTRGNLKALVKDGSDGKPWVHPRFRYNRSANDVAFNLQVNVGEAGSEADEMLPALIDDGKPEAENAAKLTQIVLDVEQSVARARSGRGLYLVQRGMIQILGESVIIPLKLAPDQQWFGLGLIGVVSARYTAVLTGISRDQVIFQMTAEPRGVPFRAASIDLLKPIDLASMRPGYAMQYIEATRRKSVAVVDKWMDLAGGGGLAKTLTALRENKPVSIAGLRDLVKKASGADLPVE